MYNPEQISFFDTSRVRKTKNESNLLFTEVFDSNGFTYIDLFSGIGGFRIALDKLGGKCLGFSEIDKHCIDTYLLNYRDSSSDNFGDITGIKYLPQADLLVGGVPCQSWSVAGKMLGFDDPRGKLWLDVVRLVKSAQPKAFIFENVKGLHDPRNRANLELILNSFKDAGYIVDETLLNSYDFGVPQIRTRLFIVGFNKAYAKNFADFTFPRGTSVHDNLAKYLDGVDNKLINKKKFIPEELFGSYIPKSRNAFQMEDELNDFFTMCDTRNGHTTIHSWDITDTTSRQKEIMLTILKNRRRKKYGDRDGNPLSYKDLAELIPDLGKDELDELVSSGFLKKKENNYSLTNSKNSSGINGIYRMYMPYSKIFSTLTASGTRDVVVTDYIETDIPPDEYKQKFLEKIITQNKFRPLTVAETQRIQGFPEYFIPHKDEKIAKKQFGNAVSPPVIEALVLQIIKTGIFKEEALWTRKQKTQFSSELSYG